MGWKVPWPILMCAGGKARATGWGQSGARAPGPVGSGSDELVAMMSMPLLSRPKKKSSPAGWRFGMGTPPKMLFRGTSPAGTIFKNSGGVGRPEDGVSVTGKLLHVLKIARFVEG